MHTLPQLTLIPGSLAQRSLLEEAAVAEVEEKSMAQLLILRLNREELGFRPVPLVGNLADATPEAIEEPPSTSQTGPFNEFTTGVKQRWVVRL